MRNSHHCQIPIPYVLHPITSLLPTPVTTGNGRSCAGDRDLSSKSSLHLPGTKGKGGCSQSKALWWLPLPCSTFTVSSQNFKWSWSSYFATQSTSFSHRLTAPTTPHPFTPTAAIIGDSIIRNVCFFIATMLCFPGATVPKITEKFPDLSQSFPPSISCITLHVVTNDVNHGQSELMKMDLNSLFNLLKAHKESVFIKGPLPTIGLGAERLKLSNESHGSCMQPGVRNWGGEVC